MLERIDQAADRLEVLLDELLTVTGFEAGVVTPNLVEVTLAEVFETVVADLATALSHVPPDPSRLTVDCPPELQLVTDPRRLRHAVRLMVDNALDRGTVVTLRAFVDGAHGPVTVEVIDNGPGGPVELGERIFERSALGPDATKPGMGLGLPVVRLLAGGLGARAEVDDNPAGAGAVFRLRFAPAAGPEPSSSSP
jgi:two-component system sensor histidine kinase TctE